MKKLIRKLICTERDLSLDNFPMERLVDLMIEMRDGHYEKCQGKINRVDMRFDFEFDPEDRWYGRLVILDSLELMETDEEYKSRIKRERIKLKQEKYEFERLKAKFKIKKEED